MTVYRPDIDRAACAATRTVHVKPRHAGDDCTADCRRPERALPSCNSGIPALDHALRFVTRFPVGRVGAHAGGEFLAAWRVVLRHDER